MVSKNKTEMAKEPEVCIKPLKTVSKDKHEEDIKKLDKKMLANKRKSQEELDNVAIKISAISTVLGATSLALFILAILCVISAASGK